MKTKAPALALLALALLALAGCADAVQRVAVPVPEYTVYRQFRVADTAESKLGAGYQYLQAYPEGTYRPEVRAWLAQASAAYFGKAERRAGQGKVVVTVATSGL